MRVAETPAHRGPPFGPLSERRRKVDVLLQRATERAALFAGSPPRRWLTSGAFWLVLLLVPGSLLLLPAWLWWKHRGSR